MNNPVNKINNKTNNFNKMNRIVIYMMNTIKIKSRLKDGN